MHLERHPSNPILIKNPDHSWEAGSVFNPTAWQMPDGTYGMLYRATNDVRRGDTGGYMSSIGLAWSHDGVSWDRAAEPLIVPDQPYENTLGCEDPRITKIGDEYYIFYTAVGQDGPNSGVRIALATTTDFKSVIKYGVIGPDISSKAATLFPQSFGSDYILLWADQSNGNTSRIVSTRFKNLEELKHPGDNFWAEHDPNASVLTLPKVGKYIEQEVGAPPLKTDAGWLFIYSGFSDEPAWTICAALLDLDDPSKVIGSLAEPLLSPQSDGERTGVVANVCFPEGAILIGDSLHIYYGSGDQGVCLATCNFQELLDHLKSAK